MKAKTITFTGSNYLPLAAVELGSGDAPTVLLAHGGGQTKRAWARTMADLASAGYRAVALDLRGHGDSGWSLERAYRVSDFGNDLLCVADALGTRPHVVGASLGGLSAIAAEGNLRPGSFKSLTLVDIVPKMDPGGVARIMGFMQKHLHEGFSSIEEAAEVIANYLPHRPKRRGGEGLKHSLRKGEDGRFRWHWDPAFIEGVQQERQEQQERMERAVSNLRLPVHLIRGASSELITAEAAEAFQAQIPHLVYSNIEGAGHMVAGDRNDAFSIAILNFLGNHAETDQNPSYDFANKVQ